MLEGDDLCIGGNDDLVLANHVAEAEGMDADLCIFDPETIIDRADFLDPSAKNEGLAYVIVDGKIVVEDGVYNGTRAAKVY